MADAKSDIIGDVSVKRSIIALGPKMSDLLVKATNANVADVQNQVVTNKLSGQVLRNRSGTLRRSINGKVEVSDAGIFGSVGTNIRYGHIHEFGYTGPETVRAHLRRSKAGNEYSVREHVRQVNMPVRSFLRSSLKDKQAAIVKRYTDVLKQIP